VSGELPGRIYLAEGETGILTREARRGPGGMVRVLPLEFGPAGVWLDPQCCDEAGAYPRWIVLRLGVLRNLDITSMDITSQERVELVEFAAEHGRELVG